MDPVTYNNGMIGGFRKVIAKEGSGALLTGAGPTFAGYFLQGAFKFGGYEFFKQQCINYVGYEAASNNRTAVYLASSAAAEFFADIALCPLEATRIRLVSDPTFASGLLSGFSKIAKQEGIGAFYSGFGPILFKQVPYTMAKFVVYEKVSEAIYKRVDKSTTSDGMQTVINLGAGLIAGFAAAIVSQPADTMLSKINKTKGLPGEGTTSRLIKIAQELGLRGSYTGIGARLFMVGVRVDPKSRFFSSVLWRNVRTVANPSSLILDTHGRTIRHLRRYQESVRYVVMNKNGCANQPTFADTSFFQGQPVASRSPRHKKKKKKEKDPPINASELDDKFCSWVQIHRIHLGTSQAKVTLVKTSMRECPVGLLILPVFIKHIGQVFV